MKNPFHFFLAILTAGLCGAGLTLSLSDSITAETIREAAKVAGLAFTQGEIDSLLPGVSGFRDGYAKNRAVDLDNAVSPAFYFDPRYPSFPPHKGETKLDLTPVAPFKLDRAKLPWYSVAELAYLIRSKQITSTDLTQFFLERIQKYDPILHCIVTKTEKLALAQAKRADAELSSGKDRGILHGIPYGVKDLLSTEDYPTTWGATPFRDQLISKNATVVEKLEKAGAVLIAKTSMGALAWGDVWFGGTTRNPWDTLSGSSGSSAGSASAVAAGLMPFAIGTETLGSIISPSTICGVTGLRPTFGRVSRAGAMALSWTMDKIGPIARNVEDCALVFSAICGSDGKDPSVQDYPFGFNANRDVKTLKIGYLKGIFSQPYPFREKDSLMLAVLQKAGINLVPLRLPELPYLSPILSAESAAAFDELTRKNLDDRLERQIQNAWPNKFRESRFIPAVEYIQAQRKRTLLIQQMQDSIFSKVDVLLHPSWAGTTLTISNYTGHPCVVIPTGLVRGKPASLSVTSRLYREEDALLLANYLQRQTGHHQKYPTFP